MNRAIKRSKDSLLEEGSIYPILILYKKGEAMEVNEEEDKHKGIIFMKNSNSLEVISDAFIADDGETIHTSHIVFSYGDGVSEREINRATKLLTKKYKPDMVGFVMSCLYSNDVNEEGEAVPENPNVAHLIHSVFYIPEVKDGFVLFSPYVNRGELAHHKKKPSDGLSDAINYDISIFDSGWSSSEGKKVRPSISNPYPRR